MSTTQPLEIGTYVYYEDFVGGTGRIVQNDPKSPEFISACSTFEEYTGTACPPGTYDYLVIFMDDDMPVPIQADGIFEVL